MFDLKNWNVHFDNTPKTMQPVSQQNNTYSLNRGDFLKLYKLFIKFSILQNFNPICLSIVNSYIFLWPENWRIIVAKNYFNSVCMAVLPLTDSHQQQSLDWNKKPKTGATKKFWSRKKSSKNCSKPEDQQFYHETKIQILKSDENSCLFYETWFSSYSSHIFLSNIPVHSILGYTHFNKYLYWSSLFLEKNSHLFSRMLKYWIRMFPILQRNVGYQNF